MKKKKVMIAMLFIAVLLIADSRFADAKMLSGTKSLRIVNKTRSYGETGYHIVYALNGGVNHSENPQVLTDEQLPVTLKVPQREGYNFAGWYRESNYKNKITTIDGDNADHMALFAKWTKAIDTEENVAFYSYKTASKIDGNQKKLTECSYRFVEELQIPGMPATRENDYINHIIGSENQCFQGLCFTEELILMTAYAEEKEEHGSLLIFDRGSGEYLATLGMKKNSHLGGLAYDGENVWICHSDSDTLERISYEYLRTIAETAQGSYIDASTLLVEYKLKNRPSCITCYGGRIWVATYDRRHHSRLYAYSYNSSLDRLTVMTSYRLPSKVQGIAFDEDGGVYLSTSFGRSNSSYLKLYGSLIKLDKEPDKPARKIEMPPCSEEIVIWNDHLYVLFESASKKYFEGTDGNGRCVTPIDKILELELASVWE